MVPSLHHHSASKFILEAQVLACVGGYSVYILEIRWQSQIALMQACSKAGRWNLDAHLL